MSVCWRVVHEVAGRIRLKGSLRLLDERVLSSLLAGLRAIDGVGLVSHSLRTQTILIKYSGRCQRLAIAEYMGGLIPSHPPVCQPSGRLPRRLPGALPAMARSLAATLFKRILGPGKKPANPIPGYILRKILMPPVLRYAWSLLGAIPYVYGGATTLLKRKLTVPVLDASALVAAFLRRDFASIGTITFLFALGGYLEYSTHKKSRQNLAHGLQRLANEHCWLLHNGHEIKTPLAEIKPGDLLVLRAGEEVPVDGSIVEGEAMVNLASITGESMPQHRTKGGWLYAGTALEEGQVVLKAVTAHDETRISRLLEFIDQAEELKAGVQMKAESRANALVPYSFAAAGLVGLTTRNSAKAASVLMVDYSCAIRLSTPLSILSAMRSGIDSGVLIKGGKFLEALAEADTLVLDKTGTLTMAMPQVADVASFGSFASAEVLRLAACLEEHFPHPLGRAVVNHAERLNLKHREEHAKVEYITAHGIVSRLDGKKILLGSEHFLMEDEGVKPSEKVRKHARSQAAQGRSLLYLAMEKEIVGILAISDPPRQEAKEVIGQLRQDGMNVHMLTGDSQETARSVAEELGINHFNARMLPSDKAAYMQRLRDSGHNIIMVGDGINDSPALALANVGITLQDGSDLARNVADVVLIRNNLEDLLVARRLGRLTLGRIRNNYLGIVGINSLLILLGITGAITPAGSALMHNAATILSALNSMRPYRLNRPGF